MNLYVPYQWLLEHLDTTADPQTLQTQLSLCGPSVERIETREGEPVFDIEVTTNRVDATSIRGIAREAAAILPEFNTPSQLKPLKYDQELIASQAPELDIQIVNNPQLCHRILALKVSGASLKPSPDWLQRRLLQVGQRPLNNAIDITNYVMWELGHPIHVFDYDRLTRKTIIVRQASKGESFTTLDQKKYVCVGGEVIFDDGTGTIIDLPGIMGTNNTTVSESTTNLLFWIESIEAHHIRFASMTHAIRSQAAVLNEKNVDPHLATDAIVAAIDLATKLTGGQVASTLYDNFPNQKSIEPITLNPNRVSEYLGVNLKPDRINAILNRLNFEIESIPNSDLIEVLPPTYRAKDITIEPDLIEEIARIYGYHNLPSQVMATPIPDHPSANDFALESAVKHHLAGWGATEVYTYSMVDTSEAEKSGFNLSEHLKIANALSDQWLYLRRSLIPSLQTVYDQNPNHAVDIFELQHVYHPQPLSTSQPELPQEKLLLALMSNQGYLHLKGLVEALLISKLHLENLVFEPLNQVKLPFISAVSIQLGQNSNQPLGRLGMISKRLSACEIDFQTLTNVAQKYPHIKPIANTPSIIEDLTFILPPNTFSGHITNRLRQLDSLITHVEITTQYQPKDSKNTHLTFKLTYHDPNSNLSSDNLKPLRQRIVSVLRQEFQAELVGSLE